MKKSLLIAIYLGSIGFNSTAIAQDVKGFQEELKITIDKPKSFNTLANPYGRTQYYQHSDSANKTFYVEPYILVDFEEARSLFAKKCTSGSTSTKKHTFTFPMHFYPGDILTDAVDRITAIEGAGSATPKKTIDVVGFPYRRLNVEFGYSRPVPIAVYSNHKSTVSQPTVQLLSRTSPISIYETCSNIEEIFDSKATDINVILELETRKFDSLSIDAQANLFIAEIVKRDFDRKEKATGSLSYRSRSSGRSGGFLGSIFGGSSSSSTNAGAVDTRKRYITATALADTLQSFEGRVQTDIIKQGVEWDQKRVDNYVDKLMLEAVSFFTKETAYFKSGKDCLNKGDSGYCLVAGATQRPVSSGEWKHVSKLITQAKANNEFELSGDCIKAAASAASGGTSDAADAAAKAKEKEKDSKPLSNCKVSGGSSTFGDINLTISGDAEKKWIPTSFDVYSISTDTLDKSVSFAVTEKIYKLEGSNAVKPIKVAGEYNGHSDYSKRTSKLEPLITEVRLDTSAYHAKEIDHELLKEYCSDGEGCQVVMTMESYSSVSSVNNEVASVGPFAFFYDDKTGRYRSATEMAHRNGTNGDNVAAHPGVAWGCFFTDALYQGNGAGVDDKKQFYVLASHKKDYYPHIGKVCTVIIRD